MKPAIPIFVLAVIASVYLASQYRSMQGASSPLPSPGSRRETISEKSGLKVTSSDQSLGGASSEIQNSQLSISKIDRERNVGNSTVSSENVPAPEDEQVENEVYVETIYNISKYSLSEIKEKFNSSLRNIDAVNKYAKIESIDCNHFSCTLQMRQAPEHAPAVQAELFSFYKDHKEFGEYIQVEGTEGDPSLFTYSFSEDLQSIEY